MNTIDASYEYCPKTCPAINSAFCEAVDKISELVDESKRSEISFILDTLKQYVKEHGTYLLRDGLCDAISDKLSLEHEAIVDKQKLEKQIAYLELELDELVDFR